MKNKKNILKIFQNIKFLKKFFQKKIIRVGVVGNISACHADARGSIPLHGVLCICGRVV